MVDLSEQDIMRLKELSEKYKDCKYDFKNNVPVIDFKESGSSDVSNLSPIWLHLENTSENIKTFYLFDFVSEKNKEYDIDLSEIKIECSFVDDIGGNKGVGKGWKMAYKMFKLICFKPVKVKAMRVHTDNELQLKEEIKYYSFSCNGLLSKKVTTPFIHKQDGQIQDCIVDINIEFTLDSEKFLCVSILPKTQLRLTIL